MKFEWRSPHRNPAKRSQYPAWPQEWKPALHENGVIIYKRQSNIVHKYIDYCTFEWQIDLTGYPVT
jgi:hypothetical protein